MYIVQYLFRSDEITPEFIQKCRRRGDDPKDEISKTTIGDYWLMLFVFNALGLVSVAVIQLFADMFLEVYTNRVYKVGDGFYLHKFITVVYIITPIVISCCALDTLNSRQFKKVKYFWLFFIPVFNVVFLLGFTGFLILDKFFAISSHFVKVYKEESDREFEGILASVLEHTKRMNNKIEHIKKGCNTKTDEYVIRILEESQRTLDILKS